MDLAMVRGVPEEQFDGGDGHARFKRQKRFSGG